MSKFRKSNSRTDEIQPEIVKQLRKIPFLSIELGHDDILVGFRGKTYWFEIKSYEKAHKQDGQIELDATWRGHYKIVWSLEMILDELGIDKGKSPV